MYPDLELFLEDAFSVIQPLVPGIGRVVVEPDYDTAPAPEERDRVVEELTQWIKDHSAAGETEAPPAGGTLAKYIRRITLRRDSLEGPWVEVAPPGNWI